MDYDDYFKLLVFSWYRNCIPYFRLLGRSNRLQTSNKKRKEEKMIFRKLKIEFPQFANLQANRVSELTHAQRVQVAKAIFHGQNGELVRHRLDMYQTMPKEMLKQNLYSALKIYYNE